MRQIGRYEIIRELGRGAMGVVYEARDTLIQRVVAIKTIQLETLNEPTPTRPDDDHLLEKVLLEARAAGALSHAGIVVVHDAGKEDGFAYIAMERVEGPTLRDVMNERRIPLQQTLQILKQAAEALDYAHEKGVVHRDIKPGNIMLHRGSLAKIADFGLAKVASAQNLTRSVELQGTPSYMAPEQIRSMPLDGRADQFSLAVTAFEMLAGQRPFTGDSMAAVTYNIMNAEPPSIGKLAPELPASTSTVLRRALAKTPEQRYATCSEFVTALADALTSASTGEEPTRTIAITEEKSPVPPTTLTTRMKRQWMAISTIVAAAAIGVFLIASGQVFSRRAQDPVTAPTIQEVPPTPAPASPLDVQFDVTPTTVEAGQAATLKWDVKGAWEISIEGLGPVSDAGSRTVFPTASRLYSLTARSSSEKKTASVEVVVRRAPSPTSLPNEIAPVVPVTPPQPATSVEGRIVWTGRLAPGEQLKISGANASSGTVSSSLPDTLIRIDGISPATVKAVDNSPGKLVLENSGNLTETLITIRWTAR